MARATQARAELDDRRISIVKIGTCSAKAVVAKAAAAFRVSISLRVEPLLELGGLRRLLVGLERFARRIDDA